MNMNRLGLVAVSVGALMTWSVAAGAAEPSAMQLAQASGTGSSSGAPGSAAPGTSSDRNMQNRDGATRDGTSAGSPSGRSDSGSNAQTGTSSGAAGAQQRFTQDLEGKDVVDSQGEKIGTVDSVIGGRLIVSSGGVLGIGDRKVALGPSHVSVSGSGTERRVVATVSRDQLKNMPEYNESTDSPSRSQSPTSPSTPGGNRSGPSGTSGSSR